MHFFHSRASPHQNSAAEPRSAWAKAHATEVSGWRADFWTISDSRTRLVDVIALQGAVEMAVGRVCMAIEWVSEGGANQLYLVSLDDGTEILARIGFPFPHRERTGEEFAFQEEHDRARIPHKMQSEVATIRYLQEHTSIPVATIYSCDSSLTNPVGSPYTLQQVIEGEMLSLRWNGMGPDQQATLIQSLANIVSQMMSLPFEWYGSLLPDGIAHSRVGPLVEPIRSLNRDYTLDKAGPWSASEEPYNFLLALAERELGWLKSKSGSKLFTTWREKMYIEEDSVKALPAFTKLAESLLEIIPNMCSLFPLPTEAWRPVLSHADFHFGNILVSRENPTIITGVIDWDFAAILPLWAAYEPPRMIADFGDIFETDAKFRKEKMDLREVFAKAVGKGAQVILDNEKSVRGLRLLDALATSGVALDKSLKKVKEQLVEIRHCVGVDVTPGVVKVLDDLIIYFSELDYARQAVSENT